MSRKIVTSNICPPIPTRQFDWCAYFDGDEETGRCGHGPTEVEAVADLIENYAEEREGGLLNALTELTQEVAQLRQDIRDVQTYGLRIAK